MMTNFEKYYDKISKLFMCNYMVTSDGEILQCTKVKDNCDSVNCIFNILGHCGIDRKREWLFDEFIPPISFSELIFVRIFKDRGWLARDKDGSLYLYLEKPTKGQTKWCIKDGIDVRVCVKLDEEYFKFIRWEDKKPVSLSYIKKHYTSKDDNDDTEDESKL